MSTKQRKPPKKATGRRPRFPDTLPLPIQMYDRLYRLVQWLQAAPPGIEPDEGLFERVAIEVNRAVDTWCGKSSRAYTYTIYVASVYIETRKSESYRIKYGDLVALLEDDGSTGITDSRTHRCVLTRGKHGYGSK